MHYNDRSYISTSVVGSPAAAQNRDQGTPGSSGSSANVSPVGLPRAQSLNNLDVRISGLLVNNSPPEEGQISDADEQRLLADDEDIPMEQDQEPSR